MDARLICAESDSTVCGGMKCCDSREYDKNRKDCQECLEDACQAMENELNRIMEIGLNGRESEL